MQGNLAEKNRKTLIFFEVMGTMFMTILYRIFLEFLTLTVISEHGLTTNTKIPFFFAFWIGVFSGQASILGNGLFITCYGGISRVEKL